MKTTLETLVSSELTKLRIVELSLNDVYGWEFFWQGTAFEAYPVYEEDCVVFLGSVNGRGEEPLVLMHRGVMLLARPVDVRSDICNIEWEVGIGRERRPAA